MRPLFLLLSLLMPALFLFAQEKPLVDTRTTNDSYAFSRGKNEFELSRNFDFSHLNLFQNDQSEGHRNDFGINLGVNHFIANDVALGLQFRADWTGVHNVSDNLSRSWMGYANFTYGKPITQNLDLYGRFGIGYGMNTNILKYSGNTTTTKDKDFGLKVEVGAPIRLYQNLYLTPDFCYRYDWINFDGGKETRSGYGVGLHLNTYLGCHEMMCDCRHDFKWSKTRYTPGNSYMGYYTHASLGMDHTKINYTGTTSSTQETDDCREKLRADYNYYFIPYVAIGAEFKVGGDVQKIKGLDNKYTTSKWVLMPMITGNLPVQNGWDNLFAQFGAGFGTNKSVSTTGTNSTTIKQNVFDMFGGVGYNDFISDGLSITPILGYDLTTLKDKNTGIKQKSRGFELQIGMKAAF